MVLGGDRTGGKQYANSCFRARDHGCFRDPGQRIGFDGCLGPAAAEAEARGDPKAIRPDRAHLPNSFALHAGTTQPDGHRQRRMTRRAERPRAGEQGRSRGARSPASRIGGKCLIGRANRRAAEAAGDAAVETHRPRRPPDGPPSHHLRQIGAPRVALVADAGGALARAIRREPGEPFEDRAVAAMLVDQPVQGIATEPPALRAFDPYDRELAE
jgi:hypothetical protein